MTHITDIHTHILPGIDDGAPDWLTCRQMLAQSHASGVSRIIATPHYLPWKKNVSAAQIRELCRAVQKKMLEETGIAINIYPGQEIYCHGDIVERLKTGRALTLADSRYVLVEFSTEDSYSTIERAVQNLREAGYVPIIAHVERYRCIRNTGLDKLHDLGALFQMNLEVVQLKTFHPIGRWAKKALVQEQIHFLASDMHNLNNRPPIAKEQLCWLEKHLNQTYRNNLIEENSSKILGDTM